MTSNLGQHFLAALDDKTVTPEVKALIQKEKILGFTLFRRNIESAEQLVELNRELQSLAKQSGYQLILAVDQEGGRVFRLPEPFSQIRPMREWGKIFEKNQDPAPLIELGRILGREISAAGFNLDFAPVVDVDTNEKNPIIGDRAFSENPEKVAKLAGLVIQGLLDVGVIPCLKHFPGHGATSADSHLELPEDDRCIEQLRKIDLVPYQNLIKQNLAPTIMTAHVLYPRIDANQPATLSQHILSDILRDELNYEGIIFSDDFLMKAILDNYDLTEASKTFFLAGGDVVLICKQPNLTLEILDKLHSQLTAKKRSAEIIKLDTCLHRSQIRIQHLSTKYLKTPTQSASLSELTKKHQKFLQEIFAA